MQKYQIHIDNIDLHHFDTYRYIISDQNLGFDIVDFWHLFRREFNYFIFSYFRSHFQTTKLIKVWNAIHSNFLSSSQPSFIIYIRREAAPFSISKREKIHISPLDWPRRLIFGYIMELWKFGLRIDWFKKKQFLRFYLSVSSPTNLGITEFLLEVVGV